MAYIENGSFRLVIEEEHGGYAQFQEYGPGFWETVEDFEIRTLRQVVDKAEQGSDTAWLATAGFLTIHWSPLNPHEIGVGELVYPVSEHFVNFEVSQVSDLLTFAD